MYENAIRLFLLYGRMLREIEILCAIEAWISFVSNDGFHFVLITQQGKGLFAEFPSIEREKWVALCESDRCATGGSCPASINSILNFTKRCRISGSTAPGCPRSSATAIRAVLRICVDGRAAAHRQANQKEKLNFCCFDQSGADHDDKDSPAGE
jgi:hypothetical protein